MGMADAGTAMTLHSAAPATILIATAFMGHLLLCGAGSVHDPARPDHSLTRHNLNPQALRWFPSQKNRDAQFAPCAEKWPEAQPIGWPAYTSSAPQEGAETIPRGGVVSDLIL